MANLIMPKMGDGMEEGTLLRWLKQVGDQIDVGDPIAEIETDKVSLEIEASESGVFTKMLVEEGQSVPIGTPLRPSAKRARPRLNPWPPQQPQPLPPRRPRLPNPCRGRRCCH